MIQLKLVIHAQVFVEVKIFGDAQDIQLVAQVSHSLQTEEHAIYYYIYYYIIFFLKFL